MKVYQKSSQHNLRGKVFALVADVIVFGKRPAEIW